MSDNSRAQMGINYVQTTQQGAAGVLPTPWEPMGDTGAWEKSRGTGEQPQCVEMPTTETGNSMPQGQDRIIVPPVKQNAQTETQG